MKRSSNVQRPSMEKAIGKAFPFVMFGTFMVFSQYESKTEGAIYLDSNECKNNNPEQAEECELAYQEAVAEAERTGPKYKTERECEYDFREDDCYYSSRYFSYIPRMGGYYYSTDLDDFDGYKKRYYSQPMYRYKKGYYSGSGQFFGSHRITPVTLASKSLKKGEAQSAARCHVVGLVKPCHPVAAVNHVTPRNQRATRLESPRAKVRVWLSFDVR